MKYLFVLLVLFSTNCFAQRAKAPLKPKGMFIMEGATCAGLNFVDDNSITFINEAGCMPWELRAKWIDDKTFITIEKDKVNEECPPRIMVYRILSFDGKTLKLKDFWVGWGDLGDETTTFTKRK